MIIFSGENKFRKYCYEKETWFFRQHAFFGRFVCTYTYYEGSLIYSIPEERIGRDARESRDVGTPSGHVRDGTIFSVARAGPGGISWLLVTSRRDVRDKRSPRDGTGRD